MLYVHRGREEITLHIYILSRNEHAKLKYTHTPGKYGVLLRHRKKKQSFSPLSFSKRGKKGRGEGGNHKKFIR